MRPSSTPGSRWRSLDLTYRWNKLHIGSLRKVLRGVPNCRISVYPIKSKLSKAEVKSLILLESVCFVTEIVVEVLMNVVCVDGSFCVEIEENTLLAFCSIALLRSHCLYLLQVDEQIAAAFKLWSDVTDLTFTPRSYGRFNTIVDNDEFTFASFLSIVNINC